MDTLIQKTAQEEAYFSIRESILSGEMSWGNRLDIKQLAEKLGMSRMPVREALLQLAAEGLVTVRPNRGVVVTRLAPEEVLEIFEMRAVLEGLAVRVGRPKLNAEAFDDLEQILGRMSRYQNNPDQWIRLHNEFHHYICQRSERNRLAQQTLLMRRSVEPYFRVFIGAFRGVEIPGSEHTALLKILKEGDAESAEHGMRDHILSGAKEIVHFLRASRSLEPPGPDLHPGGA